MREKLIVPHRTWKLISWVLLQHTPTLPFIDFVVLSERKHSCTQVYYISICAGKKNKKILVLSLIFLQCSALVLHFHLCHNVYNLNVEHVRKWPASWFLDALNIVLTGFWKDFKIYFEAHPTDWGAHMLECITGVSKQNKKATEARVKISKTTTCAHLSMTFTKSELTSLPLNKVSSSCEMIHSTLMITEELIS